MMRQDKIFLSLLSICAIAFIGLLCYLAYYNRPTGDDFCYLAKSIEHGFWGAQKDWYLTWSGRWTSTVLFTAGALLFKNLETLFPYMLLSFFTFFFAIDALIRKVFCSSIMRTGLRVLYSIFFTILLFIATPMKEENWFMLAGTATYLWPMIALFIIGANLLPAQPKLKNYLWLTPATVYLCGANETLPPSLFLFLMTAYALKCFFKSDLYIFNKRSLEFSFGLALVTFLILFLAPGNSLRQSVYEYKPDLLMAFVIGFKNTFVYLLDMLQPKHILRPIIVFVMSAYLALLYDLKFRPVLNTEKIHIKTWQIALGLILVPFALSFASFFPNAYVAGQFPATRTIINSTFYYLFSAAIAGVIFGKSKLGEQKKSQASIYSLCFIALIGTLLTVGTFWKKTYRLAPVYAQAHDARALDVLAKKKAAYAEITYSVDPLPPIRLIHNIEFEAKGGWVNDCYKRVYDLPFHLRLH